MTKRERGFTLVELLIVVAVIGIIAALAIPGLLRAKMSGNEASAIGTLRILNSAQQAYATTCGNGWYASDLQILGDPPPTGQPFISPDLSAASQIEKSGYTLDMAAGSEALNAPADGCNASGVAADLYSSYYASNQPITPGISGARWFWTNSLGTIWASETDDFDAEDVGNEAPSVGVTLQ